MNSNIFVKANWRIQSCDAACLAVLDESGSPHISTVSTVKPGDIFEVYFVTGLGGNKAKRIRADKRASVCYRADGDQVSLTGEAEILTDQETKSRLWLDWFVDHFPDGKTDPNYCVIKFTVKRVSLWIGGESAEFTVDELRAVQSRCGLLCTGCVFKESHGCVGCIETNGRPFHGECPVAQCCQDKGYSHCGECEEMPCGLLRAYSCGDSEHCDHPKGARIEVCRMWAAGK